jgi:predicted GH43/DUF377 family glycosyl hydrolase
MKFLIRVHSCSFVAIFLFFLSSCTRYTDFTLPRQSGGDPNLVFRFLPLPDPVVTRDPFTDALSPSVTANVNLYSVYDGKAWHTALATTQDGVHWQKQGIVLRAASGDYIAGNGSALSYGGQFWYWHEAGQKENLRIALARSPDARSWTKDPNPVLEKGPYASWDERAVADPYVIRIDPYFYMYYLGQDRAVRQRLGVARSTDGVHWEKLRANPIMELDQEAGLGEPAVWTSHGFYWMLYTVRDFAEEQIRPKVSQMDRDAKMDPGLIQQFFELGLMGIEIPEKFGGTGSTFFTSILMQLILTSRRKIHLSQASW